MSRLIYPVDATDHLQGPVDAPVTLVEYGDYECPYCGEAYPVLKQVQQALGDKLRFVFRNFPISELHPHAVMAAEFAEAAALQGKFWEAHDMLYENQQALRPRELMAYGQTLGLDAAALNEAFSGRFDGRIQRDFQGGIRSGVNGTPTLFVNGVRYDGERDAGSLIEVLGAVARQLERAA
ncbi:DsbA family protein [Bordetella genomosp. 1]|uniref:Disulfide bond formation protein DsbA n=1 Tax=Bordetella genomosp. 1 TaxID=1395607 RepID=A0ABX4EXS8_9BORD|nr:DsbA family protein [Bordetella genomosp. 1]OZI63888.1 disulfide bond formation protein DsbA [Bordetella genomosp. 1]